MFIEKVLKKQLKKNNFEYFIDVDTPNIVSVFVGCGRMKYDWEENHREKTLHIIANNINKQLADKGQYIKYETRQGFVDFSFHKKT